MNKLEYIKDVSTGIETISYEKVNSVCSLTKKTLINGGFHNGFVL